MIGRGDASPVGVSLVSQPLDGGRAEAGGGGDGRDGGDGGGAGFGRDCCGGEDGGKIVGPEPCGARGAGCGVVDAAREVGGGVVRLGGGGVVGDAGDRGGGVLGDGGGRGGDGGGDPSARSVRAGAGFGRDDAGGCGAVGAPVDTPGNGALVDRGGGEVGDGCARGDGGGGRVVDVDVVAGGVVSGDLRTDGIGPDERGGGSVDRLPDGSDGSPDAMSPLPLYPRSPPGREAPLGELTVF
jgi:hypothetical protein